LGRPLFVFHFCSNLLFLGGFLGAGTGSVAVIILAEFPLGDAVHRHVLDRTNAINDSLKKKKRTLGMFGSHTSRISTLRGSVHWGQR